MATSTITIPAGSPISELRDRLALSCPEYLRVDHSTTDAGNLIHLARKDGHTKELISELARNGYYLYMVQDGVSRFVQHREIPRMWPSVKNGEFTASPDGVIYTYEPPAITTANPKLLVMFSTIHDNMYSPSLQRYFMQNFKTIKKYLPAETAVLRVADIGGVTGAFYLSTVHDPDNPAKIRNLITEIAGKHGIQQDNIVLYGASKGGTGALYHAMGAGWKCLAVDPIVSDEHYETKFNDSHFTATGVFQRPKSEVFADLVGKATITGAANAGRWAVICSDRSPQFPYIRELLIGKMQDYAAFFNSRHPDIHDHPEVGVKTVNIATTLLNMLLYGMPVNPGIQTLI